ncbi:N-acyl-L-amino acid amidohydrolase [Paraliobacillus sp. PM-2]|uniref:M20 family metallopeptidase n=1 Tax=Paraliobacillus sp. PM-2 TaxID=1462524 RepID=UPI00061C0DD7|nr:M20 family metallopeptidase [Paraliobacillus sp. PM-2]CQR47093.1 N-acyl-L-amino acid amidohydrolase [Paraliobacillus sp. PM-2]
MREEIFHIIDNLYDEMVQLRREFHMYPELSFKEVNTAKKIAAYQRGLGLDVQENVGGNGIVATLRGAKPGKTVAIRADFDALPITEENEVPYKSKNPGVMHACGHDAHTAIALGISKALVQQKDQLAGNIVFIHQHAEEEDPGGAKSMIEAGALEGVDAIFATHMENYIPVGHIWHSDEYILGASDDFEITINGLGGHGAFPQDTTDVVAIGAQLVSNLHQVISRKVDPLKSAVLTIGAFQAGQKANVISGEGRLEGTVRTFDEQVRLDVANWVKQISEHTCKAFGASCEIDYQFGYPATKNDKEMNQLLINAAKDVIPEKNIQKMEPNMGAEDFSYFTKKIPGSYFFTGSANESKGCIYPYHHPKFDIDEEALRNGAKVLAAAALDFLNK